MLEVRFMEGGWVHLLGRFDASQAAEARQALAAVEESVTFDLSGLEYISSAGLGVLLKTQKRVMAGGQGLRLVNANKHIRDIFKYAGFDRIFEIGPGGA